MKSRIALLTCLLSVGAASEAFASGHRESPLSLEDPCARPTDLYAWVSPGTHDKLYLLIGLNRFPRGEEQTRLCEQVRHDFHITLGPGRLDDAFRYEVTFQKRPGPRPKPGQSPSGMDLLGQLDDHSLTYSVRRASSGGDVVLGAKLPMSSVTGLDNGGRAWVGIREDGAYVDERAFDDTSRLVGTSKLPSAEAGSDSHATYNLHLIALEIPTSDFFGTKEPPHNGVAGDDTLLGVWFSASRPRRAANEDPSKAPADSWVQVSRQGHPFVSPGLIASKDRQRYLREQPIRDLVNFGAYFSSPVLVRELEVVGGYAHLNAAAPRACGHTRAQLEALKSGRVDLLQLLNLDDLPTAGAHHVPIAEGTTGDVIRIDASTDSRYPNGRRLDGGSAPNEEQVDVIDLLLTQIASPNPMTCPLADGVDNNDRDFISEFPFGAAPWPDVSGRGRP
ncbi:MAG: DUF4331 family protein [Deltaproteobacteria bacterium]|nr:DUF4331 family protein [Deltaproteobacteria bacterium]